MRLGGRFWPLAACAAFPALVLVTLVSLVVNLPIYDEWIWSPLVRAMFDGTLRPADLWTTQGAHRSVVPTAIVLALARIDRWDTRIESVVSVALCVGTQFFLWRLFATLPARRRMPALLLASALLFSLAQSENWVWGFQISWYLVEFCTVAVIAVLSTRTVGPARFALAAIAAIAASYSLIFGFGAWMAGAIVLRNRRLIVAWAALALGCAASFLIAYRLPPQEQGWVAGSGAFDVPQFFLAYLGAPLGCFGGLPLCEALGALLVVGIVAAARRATGDRAPWLALAAFVAVADAMETVGRAGNGVNAALAFRYTTPATLGWIALVGFGAQAQLPRLGHRIAALTMTGCLAFADLAGYVYGYTLIGMQRNANAALRNLARVDDDELAEYANDPRIIRSEAARLAAARLGPYAPGD